MTEKDPTRDLVSPQVRQQIESEVRAEITERDANERAEDRDKALLALFIVVTVGLSILLPVLALVTGLALRLFWWTAGYGW